MLLVCSVAFVKFLFWSCRHHHHLSLNGSIPCELVPTQFFLHAFWKRLFGISSTVFYRPDTLFVMQPTVSNHWRKFRALTSARETYPWPHTFFIHHRTPEERGVAAITHQRRSTFAQRAFSVADPLVWNSLPDYLRDPAVSRDTFCKHLKTFLFAVYWYTFSALEVLRRCDIEIYILLTYLLTYTAVWR